MPLRLIVHLSTFLIVQIAYALPANEVDPKADYSKLNQTLRTNVADEIFKVHALYFKAGLGIFQGVLDSAALVKNKPKGAERYVKELTAYMPVLQNFSDSGSRDPEEVKKNLYSGREFFLRIYHHYDEIGFDKMKAQLLQKALIDVLQVLVDSVHVALDKFVDDMPDENKRDDTNFVEFYEEYKRELYLPKHLFLIEGYFELPIHINRHPEVAPVKYT